MEKHELSKIGLEIIENVFNALLQSRPDPMTADKIVDLRDMFRDSKPAGSVARASCRSGAARPIVRGRSPYWVKVKNSKAPAVKREAEQDRGR
jgi:hypothetical protein